MEDKVIINFDLNDEQMIREAIRNYEIYEDFLVGLIQEMRNCCKIPEYYFSGFEYSDELMSINVS